MNWRSPLQLQPAVHLAAVPDYGNGDGAGLVVYGVDNPAIACPDPQPRRIALESFGSWGPGVGGEGTHLRQHLPFVAPIACTKWTVGIDFDISVLIGRVYAEGLSRTVRVNGDPELLSLAGSWNKPP